MPACVLYYADFQDHPGSRERTEAEAGFRFNIHGTHLLFPCITSIAGIFTIVKHYFCYKSIIDRLLYLCYTEYKERKEVQQCPETTVCRIFAEVSCPW